MSRSTTIAIPAAISLLLSIGHLLGCNQSANGSGSRGVAGTPNSTVRDSGVAASGSSSGASLPGSSVAGSDESILANGDDAAATPANAQQDGATTTSLCTYTGGCQSSCPPGSPTTISGKVYDPAVVNPLYDIAVYVPSVQPDPITTGASCYTCDSLYTGQPMASALTDATGTFHIVDAPDGATIPLVVQVGKWRMQYTLNNVVPCIDNVLPDKTLHLPASQSDGDIPNIAVSTGAADSLECLFQRIGLSPAEYVGGPGGPGRLHIYVGTGGANTSPSAPASSAMPGLWDSDADLMQFDLVLLSCEGAETLNMQQQNLLDYANGGGRIFASHFHYSWFDTGPFAAYNLAKWTRGSQSIGNIEGAIQSTYMGAAFPKGVAMHDWLLNVGALTNDLLPIDVARHNADVGASNEPPSVPWIVESPGTATEYFSFDTPIATQGMSSADGGAMCGRVVYSDLHVGGASGDYGQTIGTAGTVPAGSIVPTGCANNPLSPQEEALEFMIFDLSACLTQVGAAPSAPRVY